MNDSLSGIERIMTTLSKTLLAVSAAGFAAGSLIDFGGFSVNPSLTVALPVGAVFFGLFLISFMLEKEMAKFGEEEAGKLPLPNVVLSHLRRRKQFPNPSPQLPHDN